MTVDRRAVHRAAPSGGRVRERRPAAAPRQPHATPPVPARGMPGASPAAVEMILRNIYDAVFATDTNGGVTFWTPSAERLFEYTAAQALGRRFMELLPSRIAYPSSDTDMFETIAAGRVWRGEGSVVVPSGRELWLESTVSPVIVGGVVTGSVSVSRDMTTTHAAEGELADRARLFRALNEYTTVANAVHDEEQLSPALIEAIHSVIPADYIVLSMFDAASGRYFVRATYGADSAIGAEIRPGEGSAGRAISARTLAVVDAMPRESYSQAVRALIVPDVISTAAVPLLRDGVVLGAITIARAWLGRPAFSSAELEALTLFGAHAALAISNVRLLKEISELAVHDGLTGLYNRRHFDSSLDLLLARWRRAGSDEPMAAIMFDLDRFGRLNNEHGHQAGDAVLRAFGGILHERLRSSDIVARYGGEEFVAILERTSVQEAIQVAEDVRSSLAERQIAGPDGIELHATVSAGVASLDPADPTAEALLRAADVGMFLAKRAGRNRVIAT